MNKIIYLLGFVLLCNASNAQSFTFKGLDSLLHVNFDKQENILLTKKFEPSNGPSSANKNYIKGTTRNENGSAVSELIVLDIASNTILTYATTDKETFQKIKNSLTALGYIYKSTNTKSELKERIYNNGKRQVELSDSKNNVGIVHYQIMIFK